MNVVVRCIVLSCLGLTVSCAAGVKTKYDKAINFRSYQTYAFMPAPEKKFEYLTNPDRVMLKIDEKVTAALKKQLQKMDYGENPESPDFLVAYHTGVYDKVSVLDWGYNYPRTLRYLDGRDDIELHYYKEGTLVIDFVDAKTKELIWRGAVKRIIEPGKADEAKVKERIDAAVKKILAEFPPVEK
jgi:hypothetical protein